MKYMISWFERPQGSPAEYENAQKTSGKITSDRPQCVREPAC